MATDEPATGAELAQRLGRLADNIVSAAAQAPGELTNKALARIDTSSYYWLEQEQLAVDTLLILGRTGVTPECTGIIQDILDRFGTDGQPWEIDQYVDEFNRYTQIHREHVPQRYGIAPPQPEGLQPTDLSDWLTLADTEIDSIFEQGLAAGTLGILSAPGGTGKSFLALQLLISVAIGRELIPNFTPTRSGPVLGMFAEDDNIVIARRLKALCEALQVPERDITAAINEGRLTIVSGHYERLLDFQTGVGIPSPTHRKLTQQVADSQYRLVVVDPVVKWASVPSENSNSDMEAAATAMIALAQAAGTGAVLGVHHANKQAARDKDTSQASARGGSALVDASRWMACLQELTDQEIKRFEIAAEETPNYLSIFHGKNSYAPRTGGMHYLRRVTGGALVPHAMEERYFIRVSEAIVKLAKTQPVNLTKSEILRGNGETAKQWQANLKKLLGGKLSGKNLEEGLKWAEDTGCIAFQPADKEGRGAPRLVLRYVESQEF